MKTLLMLTLSGSVLALLLLGLRYVALRRMPSTVYYYAWLLVLLRFVLPLPGLIPTPGEARPDEIPAYSETDTENPKGQVPVLSQNAAPDGANAVPSEPQSPLQASETPETRTPESPHSAVPAKGLRAPGLWLAVWAFGTVLTLGLTVLAYLRFTRRLRHELRSPGRFTREVYASIPGRRPALFCSAAVRTPLMYGVFSPKIVLPER